MPPLLLLNEVSTSLFLNANYLLCLVSIAFPGPLQEGIRSSPYPTLPKSTEENKSLASYSNLYLNTTTSHSPFAAPTFCLPSQRKHSAVSLKSKKARRTCSTKAELVSIHLHPQVPPKGNACQSRQFWKSRFSASVIVSYGINNSRYSSILGNMPVKHQDMHYFISYPTGCS